MKILEATSSGTSLTIFKMKKNINSWEKPASIGLSSQSLQYVDYWNLHKTKWKPLDEKKSSF